MTDQALPTDGSNPNPALVAAVKRLLRPVVHLLLAKGITYPYLCGLLKGIFVDVATSDFALDSKRQTDSRLSLLTGVHRKDVRRLAHQPAEANAEPENVSLGARLVARWCADSRYLDASGRPKPLPRQAQSGDDVSFEDLVAGASKDIRARAVLDEWLRIGLVKLDAGGLVHLLTDAFVPSKDFDEKAYFFGRNLHDHVAAAAQNVLAANPPFVERGVYYGKLSMAAVKELAELSERVGMEALMAVNRRALELRDANDQGGVEVFERMTFGIYFFSEKDASTLQADDHAQSV